MGKQTIGVISAGGWLGLAFSHGIVSSGVVPEERLTLSYRGAFPETLYRARWTKNDQEIFDRSQTVLITAGPEDFQSIKVTTSGKLIISLMAGITVAELSERFQSDRVVRSVTNSAATVGKSYSPWFGSSGVTDLDRRLVRRILRSCGGADQVTDESHIDYFGGLTGAGLAFPALLASAMMEDAVSRGIDQGIARNGVITLLVGTGRLFDSDPACPNDVLKKALGQGGAAAAAIEAMRSNGFDNIVAEGLAAACRKLANSSVTSTAEADGDAL